MTKIIIIDEGHAFVSPAGLNKYLRDLAYGTPKVCSAPTCKRLASFESATGLCGHCEEALQDQLDYMDSL